MSVCLPVCLSVCLSVSRLLRLPRAMKCLRSWRTRRPLLVLMGNFRITLVWAVVSVEYFGTLSGSFSDFSLLIKDEDDTKLLSLFSFYG